MRKPSCAVVENVDAAVLVSGSRHFSIRRDIDAHAEEAFGFVFGDLLCLAISDRVGVVYVDATI